MESNEKEASLKKQRRMAIRALPKKQNSDFKDSESSCNSLSDVNSSPNNQQALEEIKIVDSRNPIIEESLSNRPFSAFSLDADTAPYTLGLLGQEDGRYFNYAPSTESLLAKLENRKHIRTNSQSSISASHSWNSTTPYTNNSRLKPLSLTLPRTLR